MTRLQRPLLHMWPSRRGLWCGLALGWLIVTACGVRRAEQRTLPPPAALPNLQRASVALQQRIAREQEHVESFSQELDSLRAQEERLYAEIVEAEESYQRLQGDADAAQDDVRAVEGALSGARSTLETRRAELDATRDEHTRAQTELEAAQEAVLATRAGTTSWIVRRELAEQELADGRQALEDFRLRWRIPAEPWTSFLVQLGLGRLSLDPAAWAAPVPSPAPAPPPESGSESDATDAVTDEDPGEEPAGEPAGDPAADTSAADDPEASSEEGSSGDPENDTV